jgi:hypothetical protein
MNDELGWKQRIKTWIISVLEDLWSALWRSLLAVPAVVLLFYLLEPDPTPGLGSGMAILGLMLLTVMLFFVITFLYFRVQSRQEQNQSWWARIGWSAFDFVLVVLMVWAVMITIPLITIALPV